MAERRKRFGRRAVRRCPDVIHFAPVCGSLPRHTFRTRVALHRTAENIGIRGRPRVANELVDGLKRLIAPWKANERHRRPDQNWLHPIMRLLRPTDLRPSPATRFVTRFSFIIVVFSFQLSFDSTILRRPANDRSRGNTVQWNIATISIGSLAREVRLFDDRFDR